ncbi:MAG: ATP-grasp domain-containing protein [Eubacterium sp.]|nr:ATP-grasp domain-containing protein [Eubacterium sp.]
MAKPIIPVLLGADLNCYNVARAFHEAYGVKSYAFGRYKVSATMYSRIIDFTEEPGMEKDEVMLRHLKKFAEDHPEGQLILMGCTDHYADMIIRLHDQLPQYLAPMPPKSIYSSIQKKAEFYKVCEKYGISYPKSVVVDKKVDAAELTAEKLGFEYPIIIKASSSQDYFLHEFEGMKKVYTSESAEESAKIISDIYDSGYPDTIVLQKMVIGGDANMRVLTCFSDAKGKVRAVCLGHTMIEEHTPQGLGNHAAIVTEDAHSLPMVEKIIAMLEDIGYTGFSNFDIKRDGDSDNYYAFEINLRQGRSNYYVTGAGINIAKLVVEKFNDPGDDVNICTDQTYWHLVPSDVAFKYCEDKELVETARRLEKEGKSTCSVLYSADTRFNPLRWIDAHEMLRRQRGKFATYYPKQPGKN